jgi:hypothetical protein
MVQVAPDPLHDRLAGYHAFRATRADFLPGWATAGSR